MYRNSLEKSSKPAFPAHLTSSGMGFSCASRRTRISQVTKTVIGIRESHQDKLVKEISAWRDDPISFFNTVTKFKAVEWQTKASKAVALDPNENPLGKRRFVIRTGHSLGKTAWIANMALWWSISRPGSIVVITAPTFDRQVVNICFGEIRKWAAKLSPMNAFELQRAKLKWHRTPLFDELGLGEWMITGESASNKERIAGYHSPQGVMVIIDEASGVNEEIFEALEGALLDSKGDYRLILTGNPTKRDGEFFRAFEDKRYEKTYWRLHRSTWQTDPSIADTHKWCQEMLEKYGESSPVYRSRVLGLPPDDNPSALISYDSIVAAQHRYANAKDREGRPRIGVDVARHGDDESVIVVRFGDRIQKIDSVWGYDTVELADRIIALTKSLNGIYESVFVDEIGYGSGVLDILHHAGIRAVGVNVAQASQDKERFVNLRAELYFSMRDWFESGRAEIPEDEKLRQDLLDIQVDFESGRIRIENKDSMRRRLKRSPDRSDALMMTFAGEYAPDWEEIAEQMVPGFLDNPYNEYSLEARSVNMI